MSFRDWSFCKVILNNYASLLISSGIISLRLLPAMITRFFWPNDTPCWDAIALLNIFPFISFFSSLIYYFCFIKIKIWGLLFCEFFAIYAICVHLLCLYLSGNIKICPPFLIIGAIISSLLCFAAIMLKLLKNLIIFQISSNLEIIKSIRRIKHSNQLLKWKFIILRLISCNNWQ